MVLLSYLEHCENSPVHDVTAETAPVTKYLGSSQSAWAISSPVGSQYTTAIITIYYYYSARKLILSNTR